MYLIRIRTNYNFIIFKLICEFTEKSSKKKNKKYNMSILCQFC